MLSTLDGRLVGDGLKRLLGWLADRGGTLFLERSRPRGLPVAVAEVERALREGSVVVTFPEGTTWCGVHRGTFRPALFQAACGAGAQVVPVTLAFSLPGEVVTTAAAFVGDDDLLSSIRRVVSLRGLRISVHVHPAVLPATGDTRRTLARSALLPTPALRTA
ncbi:MAG: hypothetical protein QOI35_2747 [Cryptosporangiaceae bacterium]|nr:hypothetical protein [Cryptosporangiaceae bacterium]